MTLVVVPAAAEGNAYAQTIDEIFGSDASRTEQKCEECGER